MKQPSADGEELEYKVWPTKHSGVTNDGDAVPPLSSVRESDHQNHYCRTFECGLALICRPWALLIETGV